MVADPDSGESDESADAVAPTVESLRDSIRSAEIARDELQAVRQRLVTLCDLQDQQETARDSLHAAATAHVDLIHGLHDGAQQILSAMRRSEALLSDATHETLLKRIEGVHEFVQSQALRAQEALEAEQTRSAELAARVTQLQQELAARQLDLATERSQHQELLASHHSLRQAVDKIPPKTVAKLKKLGVVLPD